MASRWTSAETGTSLEVSRTVLSERSWAITPVYGSTSQAFPSNVPAVCDTAVPPRTSITFNCPASTVATKPSPSCACSQSEPETSVRFRLVTVS